MKLNTLYIIFVIFLIWGNVFAQPGAYGGSLEFKVYKDGKQVDLSGKNWKIIPNNGTFEEPSNPYKHPGFYQIVSLPTPMGGMVKPDFYLDIVFKKDTMKVYTPNFSYINIRLDSIPFSKGVFKIPNYVYDLQYNKILENRDYLPNLNANWNIFAKETYKCYLEKVTFLDSIDEKKIPKESRLSTPDKKRYYYSGQMIIKVDFKESGSVYQAQHKAYEVKHITDSVFWNNRSSRINPPPIQPYIKSLFYEDDTLYAIVSKRYYGFPSNQILGIYKLHFVDEEISKELEKYLIKKQIEEEYEIAVRLTEESVQPWLDQLELIRLDYEKIKTHYKNNEH